MSNTEDKLSLGKPSRTEQLIRHEKLIITAGLGIICFLSWYYIMVGAGTGMSTRAMSSLQFPPQEILHNPTLTWGSSYWVLMALMWWIMMIAMMTPSATPMILLYVRVYRHAQSKRQFRDGMIPCSMFALGYLLCWLVFSLAATALQWYLERIELIHSITMQSTSTSFSALLLVFAGIYQFTPIKHACLEHCRSPALFLSKHWRNGRMGALLMGLMHGAYCVGCCWVLMGLLFAGGIMNLIWIAGLCVLVLLEKLLPFGKWLSIACGTVMLLSGIYLFTQ